MDAQTVAVVVAGGGALGVVVWVLAKVGKALVTIAEALAAAAVVFFVAWLAIKAVVWAFRQMGVFTCERGNPIRSGNRNLLTGWKDAVIAIGRPGLHFHDLRHTGNTLAAQTYVSTKDLMARMGQDSPRAALIYQHASRQVDQTIADKLSALIEGIGSTVKDPNDGEEGGQSNVWYLLANSTQTARRQHADNIDRPLQRPRSTENIIDLGFCDGAGDGNRTRV
jgi:hypothetical protein